MAFPTKHADLKSNATEDSSTELPLHGVTVVSIEQAAAAPFATRQLADLGARVIKIERDAGDFARTYDESVSGYSSYFVWLNRTKESVVLDLKSQTDKELLTSLLKEADVLVSNLAPGAMERLGFGAEYCQNLNPQLIYATISGYGNGGSYTTRKAYDLIIQCETGLLSVTGTENSPSKAGVSVADIAAGMYTFSGILAALIQRSKTGHGTVLDVSMLEALGEWMSQTHLFAVNSGKLPIRSGAQHASIAPYGPFPTADGPVFFGLQNEREWEKFCTHVLGQPSLATDERFTPNARRVENREELHRLIEGITAQLSSTELTELLDEIGIANARLRDMFGFDQHPQLAQRDRWREVRIPEMAATTRSLIPPFMPTGAQPNWGPVPAIGENTEAIRQEFGHGSTSH
ncbi:CaiB/BaiF CoA-transferase family protein [Auritidibacter sp. NML100628]|uniref:CaiB/BaiF CoA transferase family protein n=1 Tax=Auritidibacter sp. NML100628 TaxID=2170742 RepID=UPI000D72A624|nr:CaiB/BaiF CoA-transferase family protein [Auritidibacter sp. NML100628]PXA76993.1 CoA transferase [Auritidibacter sp. NML100628]